MELINAQEMGKQYPDFFWYANQNQLDAIKVGDRVKICNGFDRFWVTVVKRESDNFIGSNDHFIVGGFVAEDAPQIEPGDPIRFNSCHIYDILYQGEKESLLEK